MYEDRFSDFYAQPILPPETGGEDPEVVRQNRENETSDLKKLLRILAISVFATLVMKEFLDNVVWSIFYSIKFDYLYLHVIDFDFFSQSVNGGAKVYTMDTFYTLGWLFSDIIVYTPGLVVFSIAFKKYKNFRHSPALVDFPSWGIPVFFVAMNSMSWIGIRLSRFIAEIADMLFGTGELRDVFADSMPDNQIQYLTAYLVIGITGPIIEEIIYRHLLLRPLRRFGDWHAVIITAVMFGAFHGNATQFLYTTIAGIFMGMVAVKANSVKPAIVIHIINNCFSVAGDHLYDLAYEGKIPITPRGVSDFYNFMNYGGLMVAILLLINHHFVLSNKNPHLTTKERAKMTLSNPWILVMAAVLTYTVWQGSLRS
ncbi:MAG: CPBP family intramembrane metalloprotease [Oscillospiraceae bacterium]|nr:CPBP family intramembrane metalloprotease [Oscillospiraceae bacterium]